jgi:hypothetical protein
MKKNSKNSFLKLLFFCIFVFLILFTGEYLWNHVLIKVVPNIKPVSSIWQIFGLIILFVILFG